MNERQTNANTAYDERLMAEGGQQFLFGLRRHFLTGEIFVRNK